MSLFEVTEAAEEIRSAADPEANIIFGTSFNERLGEEVAITVIATGFDGKRHGAASRATRGGRAPRRRPRAARLPRGARAAAEPADRDRRAGRARGPRRRGGSNGNGARVVEPVGVRRPAYDADDLEIPSFLRRSR